MVVRLYCAQNGEAVAAHEIMTQGRWKTARKVEVYTGAEVAGRAAKWQA